MWKFRRGYKLVNFSYLMYLRSTHVENLMTDGKMSMFGEDIRYPCYYAHQTRLFSNNSTAVFKPTGVSCENDDNECDDDDDNDSGCGFSGEDDDIVSGSSDLKDEELNHELGTLLEILRGCGIESEEKTVCDKPGVVCGVEVAKKLKQCGIIPTSEIVIEVLTRTRNDWEVAFMFFLWAGKQPGYTHSLRAYHSMISILAKRRKFDTAWNLIDEMRNNGIVNHNTLLIMIRRYSATHDVANAINTFHGFKRFGLSIGMEEFHKLLSALTRYKNVQEAEHLLFSNRNIFQFNTKSFNIILNGWCNIVGSPREGNRFWRLMVDQGIKLDVISYSSIISSYSKFNKVKAVIKLFEKMKETGLEPDRKVYNAVMYALAKGGRSKEALNHLHTMEIKGIAPDSVTFNSLIKPLCRARNRDEAQKVYNEMLRRELRPTVRTFHAFLRIQRTEEDVFMLLDKMKELGCNPNKDTYLLMIKKLLRWKKLDTVFILWDQMKGNGWNDDQSSYIALIHGLFLNGKLEEAHKIYSEMKEKSLLPDAKTDELIQMWLSNKHMAESEMLNSVPSFLDSNNISGMSNNRPSKRNKWKNPHEHLDFRKVVKERGFSLWD
ncbi:hypothetical protein RND81_01G102900 [Saponaria officinalis]|uniref:Pentatricopeptide repeat-containing protein n=1 Tax=Saponaria officinalis TaxID=3572 RepID=A0AAW1NFW7_SAPOF